MCLDFRPNAATLELHAEGNNQFQNSSELIPTLIYFMTLCHELPCIPKVNICMPTYVFSI